jgi:hypothetical protein
MREGNYDGVTDHMTMVEARQVKADADAADQARMDAMDAWAVADYDAEVAADSRAVADYAAEVAADARAVADYDRQWK